MRKYVNLMILAVTAICVSSYNTLAAEKNAERTQPVGTGGAHSDYHSGAYNEKLTTDRTEGKKTQTDKVKAVAEIKGTQEGSEITGKINLIQTPQGLLVNGRLKNVPNPGKHGFHIHEVGSCEDGGKAAGGHYNPRGKQHGNLMEDGMDAAHIGDLGNVEINDKGKGNVHVTLPGLALSGDAELNVSGKAIILHELEDDFGQPTGNAGGRIGCGIIEIQDKN